ncbi:MAG: GntR family transcriptional regulator [Eubacteriales bacterium]|nr:GntR family transcriptional regulator [Eubacteriales bacterium]
MIVLDYQDRRPIYEQIIERFKALIYSGALLPDSRLPSVRQLAMELSINPNTIQRAYMELEQQGLIYPVKGKGNFVSPNMDLKKKQREEFFSDFIKLLNRGRILGVTEAECVEKVQLCYKEGRA